LKKEKILNKHQTESKNQSANTEKELIISGYSFMNLKFFKYRANVLESPLVELLPPFNREQNNK